MAVRHGYGKIAGTDALVFAYDTGDTRNSYKGEPTTNLIPGVANPTLSTSGWYSTGWNGNISIDTNEGALVLNATNGWRSMSYDFGVTNGTVTVQFDYKLKSAEHPNIFMVVLNGTHLGSYTQYLFDELSTGTIYPSLTEYKTFRKTFNTTTDSKICIVLRGTDNAGLTDEMFIKNLQVEQKSHATPFVNGTRSATEGLKDLTGNSSIDLSNASFNSNAQIVLDETDDRISMGDTSFTDFGTGNFSIECVVYIDPSITVSTGHYKGIVVKKGASAANAGFGIYYNTGHGKFLWSTANGSSAVERFTTNTWSSLVGTYIHVVMVRDSNATNNGHFYINGVYESITSGGTLMDVDNDYNLLIGASSTLFVNYFLNGEVPIAKIYNRALTADEVRNNFNHYKTRFGI